jgi:hypothetical protein
MLLVHLLASSSMLYGQWADPPEELMQKLIRVHEYGKAPTPKDRHKGLLRSLPCPIEAESTARQPDPELVTDNLKQRPLLWKFPQYMSASAWQKDPPLLAGKMVRTDTLPLTQNLGVGVDMTYISNITFA